ncbi:hypothetical protein HOP52_11810 [Halomonas campisalis]|uniref:YfhG lipoprotein n=1 Tax=Billgrantia campisalis TaxID=74661 RepID=A0ABS9P9K5_9GAMM|nr:hypothetical protein [Halomonas campisalis]MCG6658438.1 hypothetical protein [Halomonas campisalis]MDR5863109.1 hypothetical protein [Halomonas campisalis]
MSFRPLCACLTALWLAGCQWLPEQTFSQAETPSPAKSPVCAAELPDFTDDACLLPDWVAFGLASQRGDRDWRSAMLQRLEGSEAERRLARAVALGWGSERQWDQASELYKADLDAAPAELQPLLRYWLNELEGRRAMAGRLARSANELAELEAENAELAEKLEALTAIERSINLRQQSP